MVIWLQVLILRIHRWRSRMSREALQSERALLTERVKRAGGEVFWS